MSRLRRLFLPASLGLVVWAALVVPLPVIVELPGEPMSLGEAVSLDGAAPLSGDYLLTKVRLRRGTIAGVVESLVMPGAGLRPHRRVVPPGVEDRTYFDAQRDLFALTAQVAAAVALEAAGFDADPTAIAGSGVRVVAVVPDTPADGVLAADDVIVAVDGRPVGHVDELRERVAGGGTRPRRLRFLRDGAAREVTLVPVATDGAPPRIGVQVETHEPHVPLPAPVRVDGGGVGGPSGGLMIALTVYDLATPDVDLAAGRRIAGTGTLRADGTVGVVSAVAQKAASAHRRGADVFVAPHDQAAAALAALPDGRMHVLPVRTFTEAVEALRAPALETSGCGDAGPAWGEGGLLAWEVAAVSTGRVDGEVPCDAAP